MNTMIIPHTIAGKGDLVVLPRKDYEALFRASTQNDWIYEKDVAKYVHSRINDAEEEFQKGKATKWKK